MLETFAGAVHAHLARPVGRRPAFRVGDLEAPGRRRSAVAATGERDHPAVILAGLDEDQRVLLGVGGVTAVSMIGPPPSCNTPWRHEALHPALRRCGNVTGVTPRRSAVDPCKIRAFRKPAAMDEEHYPAEYPVPDITPYRRGNTGIDYVHTFDSGRSGRS